MKITIYSTTTCPYCIMLKRWLDSQNIKYTDYMVDLNPIAAEALVTKSGQRGVPFTTIEHDDGKVDKILGFDQPRFEASLVRA